MTRAKLGKSVRLTRDEAESLARLAQRRRCSEAALLKMFVAEGLREAWLDEAILVYTKGKASVDAAAELAGLSPDDFAEQLELRGILAPDRFDVPATDVLQNLRHLAREWADQRLADAAARYRADAPNPRARTGGRGMSEHVSKRVLEVSEYVARTHATLRDAAAVFGVSASTVQRDIRERLPALDPHLAARVKRVLETNRAVRHIRGGESTRQKYREDRSASPTRPPGGTMADVG
ncbi:MAG TPA: sporulation transcriptional regulator SpoIIID [Micromonosporaceae bacterium]